MAESECLAVKQFALIKVFKLLAEMEHLAVEHFVLAFNSALLALMGIAESHESTVWGISFDQTGSRLASCSDDKTVKVWKEYLPGNQQGIKVVLLDRLYQVLKPCF